MVPRAGLEPARHFQTRDFKSLAYTISPPGHWAPFNHFLRRLSR